MTKPLLLGLLLLGGCQATPPPSPEPSRAELNAQAARLLWTKPDAARTLLERASTLPADNADDWARTKVAMGHVFMAKKQPENALEAWLPILERRKEVHPSIVSSTCQAIGQIHRQAGDAENAKRYFRLAVEYGKKVKYPYDFKASAKALEELERKDAK